MGYELTQEDEGRRLNRQRDERRLQELMQWFEKKDSSVQPIWVENPISDLKNEWPLILTFRKVDSTSSAANDKAQPVYDIVHAIEVLHKILLNGTISDSVCKEATTKIIELVKLL